MTDMSKNYNSPVTNLKSIKDKAVDDSQQQLKTLLENEIITRYFYRQGLDEYYLVNNLEIKKAVEILENPKTYYGFLN